MSTAVVDFDRTLITIDSTGQMLRDGFAWGSPFILWWGTILFFVRLFFPYHKQVFIRRKFRHALFREIYRRGASGIITKYAEKISPFINEDLVRYIGEHYDQVYVSTAAWNNLVEAILARNAIKGWIVQGTEYNPDFKRFFPCWHQTKVDRLKITGVEHFDVFTDSKEDSPLMNVADHIFLVKGKKFVQASR